MQQLLYNRQNSLTLYMNVPECRVNAACWAASRSWHSCPSLLHKIAKARQDITAVQLYFAYCSTTQQQDTYVVPLLLRNQVLTTHATLSTHLLCHVNCGYVEQHSRPIGQHLGLLVSAAAHHKVDHSQGTLIVLQRCRVLLLLVGLVASMALRQLYTASIGNCRYVSLQICY
jgi:hypothetical protein